MSRQQESRQRPEPAQTNGEKSEEKFAQVVEDDLRTERKQIERPSGESATEKAKPELVVENDSNSKMPSPDRLYLKETNTERKQSNQAPHQKSTPVTPISAKSFTKDSFDMSRSFPLTKDRSGNSLDEMNPCLDQFRHMNLVDSSSTPSLNRSTETSSQNFAPLFAHRRVYRSNSRSSTVNDDRPSQIQNHVNSIRSAYREMAPLPVQKGYGDSGASSYYSNAPDIAQPLQQTQMMLLMSCQQQLQMQQMELATLRQLCQRLSEPRAAAPFLPLPSPSPASQPDSRHVRASSCGPDGYAMTAAGEPASGHDTGSFCPNPSCPHYVPPTYAASDLCRHGCRHLSDYNVSPSYVDVDQTRSVARPFQERERTSGRRIYGRRCPPERGRSLDRPGSFCHRNINDAPVPNYYYNEPLRSGLRRSVSSHGNFSSNGMAFQHQHQADVAPADDRTSVKCVSATLLTESEAYKERMYHEVANLIAQYEHRPELLLRLFRELQSIPPNSQTATLRNIVANAAASEASDHPSLTHDEPLTITADRPGYRNDLQSQYEYVVAAAEARSKDSFGGGRRGSADETDRGREQAALVQEWATPESAVANHQEASHFKRNSDTQSERKIGIAKIEHEMHYIDEDLANILDGHETFVLDQEFLFLIRETLVQNLVKRSAIQSVSKSFFRHQISSILDDSFSKFVGRR
ncbi:unnamed protein product [Soboliphyme baturini]|uniref:Pericentriolar material 1 protein C-terminal domain-containing protein n=1 Tax=Soboliphyme baturini TaxID=241478 RepID=A0A183IU27_9BILA|nr:unnamed protein product [Soboliphyme baturini]